MANLVELAALQAWRDMGEGIAAPGVAGHLQVRLDALPPFIREVLEQEVSHLRFFVLDLLNEVH